MSATHGSTTGAPAKSPGNSNHSTARADAHKYFIWPKGCPRRQMARTLMWSLTACVLLTPATNASLLSSVTDGTDTCSGRISRTAASAVDTNALMCSDTCGERTRKHSCGLVIQAAALRKSEQTVAGGAARVGRGLTHGSIGLKVVSVCETPPARRSGRTAPVRLAVPVRHQHLGTCS